ncbi:putative short-chain oxidoreductase [Cystobasidium minutum MCA 4210]|uniref:putative short-chain oxidoreductase n=1 Tax=Cystobasidium minutum MCA 4210 TaxID=1397322 RepID=UPI0034CD0568|eukprot:jgi/Rhomi1/87916/CE87915_1053
MPLQKGAVFLISGCSSGLGRAFAETALKHGYRVIATARKLESIQDLKEKGASILKLDTTSSPDELHAFAKEAWQIYGRIDVLINNAGYLLGGAIEEASTQETLDQFSTLVFGVINVTSAFLPYLRKQGSGNIVNISSQVAVMDISGAGLYCAAKAAVDSLSGTWHKELAPFGINTISIQLGTFATSVASSDNVKVSAKHIPDYEGPHAWVKAFNAKSGTQAGDAYKAAERIITLLEGDRTLPKRLPLGNDAHKMVTASLEASLKDCHEWKEASIGTNRN